MRGGIRPTLTKMRLPVRQLTDDSGTQRSQQKRRMGGRKEAASSKVVQGASRASASRSWRQANNHLLSQKMGKHLIFIAKFTVLMKEAGGSVVASSAG